ncbi:hypothetical protein D3C81_305030 [compost metagenome]
MSEENKTELDPVQVYSDPLNGRTPEEAAEEVTSQILHHMGLDKEPSMAIDLQEHIRSRAPEFDPNNSNELSWGHHNYPEPSGFTIERLVVPPFAETIYPATAATVADLSPREEPIEREPLRMPTLEETIAKRNDPFERAKADQRRRLEEADQSAPEWSRALAESKPSLTKVEYLLEQGACRATGDAGAMARDALLAVQRLKRENKRKRIRFWSGWLVFLLLIAGITYGTWRVLPEYVVTGRYTVPSTCSVPLGKGELTGNREYSYQYKSLFGYHLVDESTALERTTIDVKGDKLIVLGWDKTTGKTWRQNIGMGEKGIAILKHADIYWFLTDKDMATVPYSAFCN